MFDDNGFDLSTWRKEVTLTLCLGDLLILHGQLSLALRHPNNDQAASERARMFINEIECIMWEGKMLSTKALQTIKADERTARTRERA